MLPIKSGILNKFGKEITKQDKMAMGLYPTPNNFNNLGNFRLIYHQAQDTEKSVTQFDRLDMVRRSQALFASMPCLSVASEQKAEWTIGNAFEPVYNVQNQAWKDKINKWLLNYWFYNCSTKGFAYDFKTIFKLISKMLDENGDVLMLLINTRKGAKIQFVGTHRVQGRNTDSVVKGFGKWDGYKIEDGVISNDNDTPIGYYIQGDKPEDDYIASVADAYLIFTPKFLDKPRGLPGIASALLTGQSINEIDSYLQTTIKLESLVHLKNFNETGEAPLSSLANVDYDESTNIVNEVEPPHIEVMQGGISYIKHGSGDIQSFATNRPATETQEFVRRLEVHLLSALGIPHQIIYSPETVGGASARGISEVARRTIKARQILLEKYAKIAINFAVSVAIVNGDLPENNQEEWWNLLTLTRTAEFTLDSGYERAADINDYKIGAKSLDEITTKYGTRLAVIQEQRKNEVIELYNTINTIQKQFPDITKEQIHNDLQMLGANAIPIPVVDTQVTDVPTT